MGNDKANENRAALRKDRIDHALRRQDGEKAAALRRQSNADNKNAAPLPSDGEKAAALRRKSNTDKENAAPLPSGGMKPVIKTEPTGHEAHDVVPQSNADFFYAQAGYANADICYVDSQCCGGFPIKEQGAGGVALHLVFLDHPPRFAIRKASIPKPTEDGSLHAKRVRNVAEALREAREAGRDHGAGSVKSKYKIMRLLFDAVNAAGPDMQAAAAAGIKTVEQAKALIAGAGAPGMAPVRIEVCGDDSEDADSSPAK